MLKIFWFLPVYEKLTNSLFLSELDFDCQWSLNVWGQLSPAIEDKLHKFSSVRLFFFTRRGTDLGLQGHRSHTAACTHYPLSHTSERRSWDSQVNPQISHTHRLKGQGGTEAHGRNVWTGGTVAMAAGQVLTMECRWKSKVKWNIIVVNSRNMQQCLH